jgi:A/G-specific adenine glycosylase
MDYTYFSKNVLNWYSLNKRDLPWRYKNNSQKDPYKIWVSEIMLQQTTVQTVIPYYKKFIKRWPNVKKLSTSNINEVLDFWSGLGYYRRAKNLHLTSKIISNQFDGVFPLEENEIIKLPGIGEYTAAAIRAIAKDEEDTVVDANIERVRARVFYLKKPIKKIKKEIKQNAKKLTPKLNNGDYIQALMDIGSLICTPKDPLCNDCPIEKFCITKKKNAVNEIPKKIIKNDKPVREGIVFWIKNKNNQILLKRRDETGLLPGMLEFPSYNWSKNKINENDKKILSIKNIKKLNKKVIHEFSHFKLKLTVYEKNKFNKNRIDGMWVGIDEINELGLPTLMKKVYQQMMKNKIFK